MITKTIMNTSSIKQCPKCQSTTISMNEDGDLECMCGHVIYKNKLLVQHNLPSPITNNELIDVHEASKLLHVNYATVHHFIDRGWLNVINTKGHSFLLSTNDIIKLNTKRPLLKCLDCGYEWHKRFINGQNRCIKRNCRSVHVVVMGFFNIYNNTPIYVCNKCQHEWRASKNTEFSKLSQLYFRKPKQCPHCNSRRWRYNN